MHLIINKLRMIFFKNKQKVILGRWNVDECYKTINRKIDLSNTDHCGTCITDNVNNSMINNNNNIINKNK